jgi:hypothetical protein
VVLDWGEGNGDASKKDGERAASAEYCEMLLVAWRAVVAAAILESRALPTQTHKNPKKNPPRHKTHILELPFLALIYDFNRILRWPDGAKLVQSSNIYRAGRIIMYYCRALNIYPAAKSMCAPDFLTGWLVSASALFWLRVYSFSAELMHCMLAPSLFIVSIHSS